MSGLSPQFSLPNTSSEMANLERYWEFQDAMPCKVRAKRGCATHPRSIAERVSTLFLMFLTHPPLLILVDPYLNRSGKEDSNQRKNQETAGASP